MPELVKIQQDVFDTTHRRRELRRRAQLHQAINVPVKSSVIMNPDVAIENVRPPIYLPCRSGHRLASKKTRRELRKMTRGRSQPLTRHLTKYTWFLKI